MAKKSEKVSCSVLVNRKLWADFKKKVKEGGKMVSYEVEMMLRNYIEEKREE
jgi:hypothetical protein